MDTISSPCPIIVRLLEAMGAWGVNNENEKRKLIKEITGVSKQNLQHWFNGTTTTPGVDHLAKLAESFDIDLNWLITGHFKEKPSKQSASANDFKEEPALKNDVIDRLCEGLQESGISDIKTSLMHTANDVFNIKLDVVAEWFNKKTQPSFEEAARLCEFYGIALRYVAIGKGPKLALDYIRAIDNKKHADSHPVIQLQDVALLGNV